MSTQRPSILGEDDPKHALRNQGLALMMKGALYGVAVFVGILAFVYVIAGIGSLLPEDSKFAPDPTPSSSQVLPLDAPETDTV